MESYGNLGVFITTISGSIFVVIAVVALVVWSFPESRVKVLQKSISCQR